MIRYGTKIQLIQVEPNLSGHVVATVLSLLTHSAFILQYVTKQAPIILGDYVKEVGQCQGENHSCEEYISW